MALIDILRQSFLGATMLMTPMYACSSDSNIPATPAEVGNDVITPV